MSQEKKTKERTKVDELRDALKSKKEQEGQQKVEESNSANVEIDASNDNTMQDENLSAESSPDLTEQIRIAEEEAKAHYDKLLRVVAEFENFKRRMQKEREDAIRFSNERLLGELLTPLDDLDRVLEHIPQDASNEVKSIGDGIELVRKSLKSVLERFGLKEVLAVGCEFDPTQHEAIAAVPSETHPANSVMAVHRKGYKLEDRLLRAAMVTVVQG